MVPLFARRRSMAEDPSATSNTSKPTLRSVFVTAWRKASFVFHDQNGRMPKLTFKVLIEARIRMTLVLRAAYGTGE